MGNGPSSACGRNDITAGVFGSRLGGSGQQECTRGGAGQPSDHLSDWCRTTRVRHGLGGFVGANSATRKGQHAGCSQCKHTAWQATVVNGKSGRGIGDMRRRGREELAGHNRDTRKSVQGEGGMEI